MDTLSEWGPIALAIATAISALAVALRTHATSSASTVQWLRKELAEAKEKIAALEGKVAILEEHRDRLAAEVDALAPYKRRAESLHAELLEERRARDAGGGAEHPAPERREPGAADVVRLVPTAAADALGPVRSRPPALVASDRKDMEP